MLTDYSLGVLGVVRKTRRLLMHGQTRIHLDEVRDLGHFIELEVVLRADQPEAEGVVIAEELTSALDIRPEDLVRCAYIDLLAGG